MVFVAPVVAAPVVVVVVIVVAPIVAPTLALFLPDQLPVFLQGQFTEVPFCSSHYFSDSKRIFLSIAVEALAITIGVTTFLEMVMHVRDQPPVRLQGQSIAAPSS